MLCRPERAWFPGEGRRPGLTASMAAHLEPSPRPSLQDPLHLWAREALRSDRAARGHPSPPGDPRATRVTRAATLNSCLPAGGGRLGAAVRRRILPARSSAPMIPSGAGPRVQGPWVWFPVHGVAGSLGRWRERGDHVHVCSADRSFEGGHSHVLSSVAVVLVHFYFPLRVPGCWERDCWETGGLAAAVVRCY